MFDTDFEKPGSITARKKKYSEIYAEYDELLKKYNICNIRRNEKGITVCNGCNDEEEDGKLCCRGCRHLSKKGCRVKSLSCKIWLCYTSIERFCKTASKEDIIYFFGMKEYLHQQIRIHNIHHHIRESKKQNFAAYEEN